MSIAKQIAIAVIATIVLVIVGIGSYMLSTQVIPDPSTSQTGTNNNTNGQTQTTAITVKVVQNLTPKNMLMKKEGTDVVVQFDTEEKTGAILYLTSDKSERIDQVVKDWSNGVTVKGTFYTVTQEDTPSTAHQLKIPNADGKIKSDLFYFYIILMYNKARIPYGGVSSPTSAPTQPYILKFI